MKKLLVFLLVFSFACPRISAKQQQPDQKHIESIKKKVESCVDEQRTVAIQTYDGRRLQGTISEAGPEGFVLSYNLQNTSFGYAEVKKIKWHSQVSKQGKALIGAAIVTGGLLALVLLVATARD